MGQPTIFYIPLPAKSSPCGDGGPRRVLEPPPFTAFSSRRATQIDDTGDNGSRLAASPVCFETRVFFEAPVPRVSDASVFETVRFTGATRCFCFSASRALRRRSGNSPTRCYPRNLADFDSRTVAPWKRRPAPTRFFTGKKELTLQTAKVKRSRNTTFDVSAFSSRKHPPSRRRREAHAAFPARAAAERRAPTREDAVLR